MGLTAFSDEHLRQVNDYLERSLRRFESSISQRFVPFVGALRYSLEGSGKRLRPLLTLHVAEYVGIPAEQILPAACAIEYIHTYSLIHDDLPALDDDDTRRNKPSSHVKYGEAVAILAGDALLTEAFSQMYLLHSESEFPPERVLRAIQMLAHHAGIGGMVGGQYLDVTSNEMIESLPELEFIHIHKTGALILASVMIPTLLADLVPEKRDKIKRYGEALGLAFQISDDILDSEAAFRYSRGPRKKPKPNYTKLVAPGEIRDRLNGLVSQAIDCIEDKEKGKTLVEIAEFIRARKH